MMGFVQHRCFRHIALIFLLSLSSLLLRTWGAHFSASLILLLHLIFYFSHFCTLLHAVCICLFCTACLPLPSLCFFCFKPCFPGILSGYWLFLSISTSFYFGCWFSCLVYTYWLLYHSMFIILMQLWYYFIYF